MKFVLAIKITFQAWITDIGLLTELDSTVNNLWKKIKGFKYKNSLISLKQTQICSNFISTWEE